jgi:methylphosphotriester-DNA--protein-cysteine methyltransferase
MNEPAALANAIKAEFAALDAATNAAARAAPPPEPPEDEETSAFSNPDFNAYVPHRKRCPGNFRHWRNLTGFTKDDEPGLRPVARRAGIRKFLVHVNIAMMNDLDARRAEAAEFPDEQTPLWDPIIGVCTKFEIAPLMLSRLIKELTGMNASQYVDRARAVNIRAKIRRHLTEFFAIHAGKPGEEPNLRSSDRKLIQNLLWKRLKEFRRDPSYSRATHAIEFGFANYNRYYNGCLRAQGKTPVQLENEVILELAESYANAGASQASIQNVQAREDSHIPKPAHNVKNENDSKPPDKTPAFSRLE